ncbi:14357_t:CDS:1 [Ambispora leptoticha]|uniref:14357_t:CDS:1 n=1 Tax=Ambispora leptoticha TaxID=144679 RepID=A0A9N9GZN0_9GLOM|nr:14357_t:CDS:1 [Ambispora leptoticha]
MAFTQLFQHKKILKSIVKPYSILASLQLKHLGKNVSFFSTHWPRGLKTTRILFNPACCNDNTTTIASETSICHPFTLLTKSPEYWIDEFRRCKDFEQLHSAATRFFYYKTEFNKHSNAALDLKVYIAALNVCRRLVRTTNSKKIAKGENKSSFPVLNETMQKFWIDIPKKSYTTKDILKLARRFFDHVNINSREHLLYTHYMAVLACAGHVNTIYTLLEDMQEQDIRPNSYAYKHFINACVNSGDLERAFNMIDTPAEVVSSAAATESVGHYSHQPSLFKFLLSRDSNWVKAATTLGWGLIFGKCILYSSCITDDGIFDNVLLEANSDQLAILTFGICSLIGMRYFSLNLIGDSKSLSLVLEGRYTPENVEYPRHFLNTSSTNSGTNTGALSSSKNLNSDYLYPEKLRRNLYCTMINSLLKNRQLDDALQVFSRMIEKKLPLDYVNYKKFIESLCQAERLHDAVEVTLYAKCQGKQLSPSNELLPIIQTYQRKNDNEGLERFYNIVM